MNKKFFLYHTIVLALGGITACSTVQHTWHSIVGHSNPLVGKIWSVREKQFVTDEALVDILAEADFVLLGEKHDNRDHHDLQNDIVQSIAKKGKKPRLAMEQIGWDQKDKLSSYIDLHPGDASALGDVLGWKQSGWPDWKYYEPIVQSAMEAKWKILGVNLSQKEKQKIDQVGIEGLDDSIYRDLELQKKFSASVTAMLSEEIRSAHCYKIPDEVVPRMIEVQKARDAVIAYYTEKESKQDGAVMILGLGHARNEWGVPVYLRRLNRLAKIVTVAFMEVKEKYTKPEIYVEGRVPYDYIWFTPAIDTDDPCVKHKNELKKIEHKKR